MSQGVEQRRRELGVRLALGAQRSDILRLIIRRVLGLTITGIVVGLALAVPATRLLTTLLYQVEPGDPAILAALALVLLAVALLSGYLPAKRATEVDPLSTLRDC
jgi:ABC-type antimicrobial peptide transport system permease subunit